jgi:hypothetical protein|tara:strand:- start:102 stop:530 length:429 start_codon:yes stop_codon:yes gene_type:complete
MKRFLTLILFSILIPIQNSSAVSPSLDETIDWLVNGGKTENKWSIDNCNLTLYHPDHTGLLDDDSRIVNYIIDLNKVDLNDITPDTFGFSASCKGDCKKINTPDGWKYMKVIYGMNGAGWKRNKKALDHLYSNFCTGFKSIF